MPPADWVTLIFAGEVMLVSLVVCARLFVLLRRCRRQIDQLQSQVAELTRRQISQVLEREIANTRDMARRSPADQRLQPLARLRLQWLQLEQRALVEEGDRRSDFAVLERSARPLLAMLGESTADSTGVARSRAPSRSDNRTDDALKQARATILLQKEIIGGLKQQLEVARSGFVATSATFSAGALDRVSANADAQLASVAKLERELKAARASYRQVSDELARLQARGGDTGVLVITADEPRVDVAVARSLLGDMESARNESLTELHRMRETNARQRALILELERELTQMRKGSGEEQASQVLLRNLQQQLLEYEHCTATLELETENLRARIATLNSIVESAEREGHVDVVANVQQQLAELESLRRRSQLLASAFGRLAEMAELPSIEQVLTLLRAEFGESGQRFALMAKGTAKLYWLASDGDSIDERVRHLLQSVVPAAGTPWIDVKGGAIFVGTTLRLFLERGASVHEKFARKCGELVPKLRIVDALLCLLDTCGRQQDEVTHLRESFARTARQLTAIDVQHHYLSEENARIGENLQSELRDYFSALHLTDIQRECIEAMLADFRAEATLLVKASTTVHKSLRALLQDIDSNHRTVT